MSIVTKTGDKGETGLLSGERVSKADPRVEAYGTLDELVTHLGLVRAFEPTVSTELLLKKLQIELFRLGAELAATALPAQWKIQPIAETDVLFLEEKIVPLEKGVGLPRSFVLPGNTPVSATLDQARTTCRRLERRMVGLIENKTFSNQIALRYVNRLSDLLFILARHEQLQEGKALEPVETRR